MNKFFYENQSNNLEYLPEKNFFVFHWSNQNKPRDSQLLSALSQLVRFSEFEKLDQK